MSVQQSEEVVYNFPKLGLAKIEENDDYEEEKQSQVSTADDSDCEDNNSDRSPQGSPTQKLRTFVKRR